MFIDVKNKDKMKDLGKAIGTLLCGGEIIELIGDVGAGKTTLVKGIAVGLGIDENVQSPSFTINRVYNGRDGIILSHYDFYRLNDAGIMANELQEVIDDKNIVTVIEWGGAVAGILPIDRLTINISAISEYSRKLDIKSSGEISQKLMEKITE
ncbi:tRNA (adenosine(37)-N6)-threonylcarbamoyltransferase complex ATPase subunit type 1 TsaE [Candidatus Saccharibacteria bacterium CG11_big_fil_rev_8_21_14_0_20_41_19]|nr:tRNA (adenosine(37)-N6)-threonylcarbamoyltransferase complex ATPase subunit type 1 TsaE [Candidatus Saccharibacteria bacterium]OIP86036.1 MAG: tRNA (adenosine(37)-N6)-threonylcarbamoyltransferase complex ATPase subunit type 1 TsaE [Candidatus Saccharibacteria bacterium CG2_30_41_52]PIQ70773.1 MAG: tRNA (adenosine(37)-N6)-threonylcarbamoyltransferase complex ATPase subunit type 1 TsaE [Candidatus Saccharibacteria bacterium CG11_big_fil_rev_8_21_14_0_20_41_19]PJC30043.1 MAG: tRNA (adenosine(37)